MPAHLTTLAEERSYDALEGAWLEAAEAAGRGDLAPFLAAAETLASQNEPERAAVLLALLVGPLKEAERPADALRVVRRAVELAARAEELRGDLVGLLRKVHEDRPGFEAYLKLSGLADRAPPREALQQLDRFLEYPVGRHVWHAAGWGVGRVKDVDRRTGDLLIDFERKPGHALPVESAIRFLKTLPDDHLWALRHSSREKLLTLAEQAPGDLVKIAVRSRAEGRASLPQIKQELIPAVVPEKGWTKFWSRAKSALLRDPMVAVSDDARPVISLREEAVTFAEEVHGKVEKASSLEAATAAARQLLRQAGAASAGEVAAVAAALARRLALEGPDVLAGARPGAAVEAWFVIDDFQEAGAKLEGGEAAEPAPLRPAIAASRDLERFPEVAATIEEGAYLKRYVERVKKENAETWPERFAAALQAAPRDVFALAAASLKEANAPLLGRSLARIVSQADPDPEAFIELAKESFAGKFEDVPGAPEPFQVLERLFAFADRLERLRSGGAAGVPNLRPRVRALLEEDDYGIVRRYFKEAEKEAAKHLYHRIMASHAIDDEVREVARAICVRRMPAELAGEKGRRRFWDDEAHVYVTRSGLAKYEQDFQELANVKIPENARAIGEAARHGDLSENAEFTAALEERDHLTKRAARMKADLERARPLEEAPLEEGVVGPGMRVELDDPANGSREAYTILGPWDADLEKGVISYTAPLAKGILGRRVGESVDVQLPGGTTKSYVVAKIERAI